MMRSGNSMSVLNAQVHGIGTARSVPSGEYLNKDNETSEEES